MDWYVVPVFPLVSSMESGWAPRPIKKGVSSPYLSTSRELLRNPHSTPLTSFLVYYRSCMEGAPKKITSRMKKALFSFWFTDCTTSPIGLILL
jgi:hypothetical protein